MEILNSGDVTHFHSQTSIFTIDLSLCTSNSFLHFDWKVLPDLHGSDHLPVLLESTDSAPQSRPPRWRLYKADWHLFKDLNNSALLIPKTCGQFPKRPVPCWNGMECTAAVQEKRSAFSGLLSAFDSIVGTSTVWKLFNKRVPFLAAP